MIGSDDEVGMRVSDVGKANVVRDAVAGVFLVLGLLLPWNVYFGVGIDGTSGWVFALLVLLTVLLLAALGVTHVGRRGVQRDDGETSSLARLRLVSSVPYLALASSFVVFTVVQSLRGGGTALVPPGIGPGVWFGMSGAILAAQRVIASRDDEIPEHATKVLRVIGIASLVVAVLAVLFNLYWRTRFVAPNIDDEETGTQNLVVFVAALLYGLAALAPVAVVSRWIVSADRAARLATVLVGSAVLVAGAVVWILPVGRDLDSFHGIAQNTSTAGVGFEGYLAWVTAAAIVATPTMLGVLAGRSVTAWRGSVRKCLVLIVVWCSSSAVLRIVDLASTSVLDLPSPAYNGIALMAFDLAVALLAMWLFVNGGGGTTPRLVLVLLSGILFVLTVARLIVGIALVPRVRPLNITDVNPVYGNTLAQQITSTFDVALCVLALAMFAFAFAHAYAGQRRQTVFPLPIPTRATAAPESETQVFSGAETVGSAEHFSASQSWSPTGDPAISPFAPQVLASAIEPDASAWAPPDRVAEVLAESTRRFAAGTTYGTAGPSAADQAGDSNG